MMWCKDMDACLEGDHDHFAALQEFELTNFDVGSITSCDFIKYPAATLVFSTFFFLLSDVCVCPCVIQRLNALAALVRGQLPALHRNIITALITIDVHARDIVTDLISQKVQYCYTVITIAEALVMCRSWFSNTHIHPIRN